MERAPSLERGRARRNAGTGMAGRKEQREGEEKKEGDVTGCDWGVTRVGGDGGGGCR